jgi:hypothetical protein
MHITPVVPVFNVRSPTPSSRLALLLLGLLKHLLDDLLLLNQESANDAVLDAVGAAGAAIGTLDGLLGAADLGVLAGAESGDTGEFDAAVLGTVSGYLLGACGRNLHRTWARNPSS